MGVIFVNLYLWGIFKIVMTFGVYFGLALVLKAVNFVKFRVLRVELTPESRLLNGVFHLFHLLGYRLLVAMWGILFNCTVWRGRDDPQAKLKALLHKSYLDGFLIHLQYPSRMFADKWFFDILPLFREYCYIADVITVDRKDKSDKKSAIFNVYEHMYHSSKVLPLTIFVEGCIMPPNKMNKFKNGAFGCLQGVQPMVHTYHPDFITGIDISNSRSMLVEVLLTYAKCFSIIEIEFLATPLYEGERVDVPMDGTLQELKTFVEAHKEPLKTASNRYASQVQAYVADHTRMDIIPDFTYFDGWDAVNYYTHLSDNIATY